jgi:hypothetical protein
VGSSLVGGDEPQAGVFEVEPRAAVDVERRGQSPGGASRGMALADVGDLHRSESTGPRTTPGMRRRC